MELHSVVRFEMKYILIESCDIWLASYGLNILDTEIVTFSMNIVVHLWS